MLDVDGLAFMGDDPAKPGGDEEQRMETQGWLLRAAFIDIITGLNESLIEACKIVRLARSKRGSELQPFPDEAALERHMDNMDAELMRAHIPDLLKELSSAIDQPLALDREIRSINQLRNCLIHRNGIVAPKDVNTPDAQVLRLSYLAHKVYVLVGDEEHEVDRTFKSRSLPINAMMTRPIPALADFPLGSAIGLDADLFNDVAFTSYLFLRDIRLGVYSVLGVLPQPMEPEIILVGTE